MGEWFEYEVLEWVSLGESKITAVLEPGGEWVAVLDAAVYRAGYDGPLVVEPDHTVEGRK